MKADFKGGKPELYVDAIGLNTIIILSKELFPTNNDIRRYTDENIEMELKDYLFDSRTLLIARTNRYIYNLEIDELKRFYESVNIYITNESSEDDPDDQQTKKDKGFNKNNKSKENLQKWLDKI